MRRANRGILNSKILHGLKVKEVMNRKPPTVPPEAPLEDLFERLLTQAEDFLLVVDERKRLLGVITESDVLQALHPHVPGTVVGSLWKETRKTVARTAGEIMTENPVTATPDMTVHQALDLMRAHKVRRLPVVEGQRLVGQLSVKNILEIHKFVR
ncbi:MAG: CBS domain-containing protein [Candidatus Hadarchaeales archaeon]